MTLESCINVEGKNRFSIELAKKRATNYEPLLFDQEFQTESRREYCGKQCPYRLDCDLADQYLLEIPKNMVIF